MLLNYGARELYVKIVYYGPGLAGKTTNLEYIHDHLPAKRRSRLISLQTDSERTLFFDFMPVELGTVGGLKIKLQLYTVPGQIHYEASRKLILRGTDGVVMVIDSQRERIEANCESLEDLLDGLRDHGLDVGTLPRLLQYNKRDTPTALELQELRRQLNPDGHPEMPAVAQQGFGVHDTLREITRHVLRDVKRRLGQQG